MPVNSAKPAKNHFFWNRDGTVRLKYLQRILEVRRGDFSYIRSSHADTSPQVSLAARHSP